MTLADTNFWLALTLSKHVFHQAARDWFDEQSPRAPVLFCRSTQQSFLRLLTTDAVLRPYEIPPMTNAQAWQLYDGRKRHRVALEEACSRRRGFAKTLDGRVPRGLCVGRRTPARHDRRGVQAVPRTRRYRSCGNEIRTMNKSETRVPD